MSQDLQYIRKQLTDCEEVDSPFDIETKSIVKYITLNEGEEYFYDGGTYVGMKDNRMILQLPNRRSYVPLFLHNPDGTILYRTRLFVQESLDTKEETHLQSIIQTQQSVIDKLTESIQKVTNENNQLKQYIQKSQKSCS